MGRPAPDIARVANLWHLANWLGTSTEQLIADRLNITLRHAGRLVRTGRDHGYIPENTRSTKGKQRRAAHG